LLLVTGVVLWLPLDLATRLPALLPGLSWVLHDAGFLLFAVAIVVHIYLGTAALPGTFRSMTRGTVTKAWAKLHHPRWYRETTGDSTREAAAGTDGAKK
jgi:formate dehydrogenase subunit gamma